MADVYGSSPADEGDEPRPDPGGPDAENLPHFHCDHCFKGTKCDAATSFDTAAGTVTICDVIGCPNACGSAFHRCKLDDHLLLCPLAKVRCLNAIYGCPLWLLRCRQGSHLGTCPASVVHCSFQRSRRLLDKEVKTLTKATVVISSSSNGDGPSLNADDRSAVPSSYPSPGSGPLPPPPPPLLTDTWPIDIALALDDQQKILDLLKVKKSVRKKHCNYFNKFYPIIPLTVTSTTASTRRSEAGTEETPGASGDHVQGGQEKKQEDEEEEEEDDDEDEEQRPKLCPVSRECLLCRMDPSSQHLHTVGSMQATAAASSRPASIPVTKREELPEFYQSLGLHFGLSSEFVSAYTPKPKSYFTIMCGRKMRRDEMSDHYRNVHLDVVSSLDGWMVARCPNFLRGCDVFTMRLRPSSSTGSNDDDELCFDAATGTFPIRAHVSDQGPPPECLNLLALPDVALVRVMCFLDPFGLYCVSQVCRRLRALCRTVLPRRGLVELTWAKQTSDDGAVYWKPSGRKWFFSREFLNHVSWTVQPVDRILNHLKQCPFSTVAEHPSKVPVLTFLRHKSSVSL